MMIRNIKILFEVVNTLQEKSSRAIHPPICEVLIGGYMVTLTTESADFSS